MSGFMETVFILIFITYFLFAFPMVEACNLSSMKCRELLAVSFIYLSILLIVYRYPTPSRSIGVKFM